MQMQPSQHTHHHHQYHHHHHHHQQQRQSYLDRSAHTSSSSPIPSAPTVSLGSSTLRDPAAEASMMLALPLTSSNNSALSKRSSPYSLHPDHDDDKGAESAKKEAGSSSSIGTTSTTYAYAQATLISRSSSMAESEPTVMNVSQLSPSPSPVAAAGAGAGAGASSTAANGTSTSPSTLGTSLPALHALPSSAASLENSSMMDYIQAPSSTRPTSQQPHQQPQPFLSSYSDHQQQQEPQTVASHSPLASSLSLNNSPYHNSYPLSSSSSTTTTASPLKTLQGHSAMSPLSTPFTTSASVISYSSPANMNTATTTPMATIPSSLTQYRSPTLTAKATYGLRTRSRRDSTPNSNSVAFSPPSTYGSPLNQHQQLSHHSSGLVFQAANNHRLSHLLQTSPYPPRSDRTRCLSTSSVESNVSCSPSASLSRLTPAMASMSVYQASPLGGNGQGGGYNSGASSPYYSSSPPSNSYANQHATSSSSYQTQFASPLQHQQPVSFSSPTSSAANAVVAAAAAAGHSYHSSHAQHTHGYTSPTSPPPSSASVTSATASPLSMGATHSLLTQDPVRLLQQLEFTSHTSSSSATAASSLHGRLEQAVGSGASSTHAQQHQQQTTSAATQPPTTTGSSDMCLGVQDGFQPYMAIDSVVSKTANTTAAASASATSDFGLGIVMMPGADGVPIVGNQTSGAGLQAMQSNAAEAAPSPAKVQAEPKMILSEDGKTQLFPCGQCEKVFTTKSNLKRHLENINIHNTPYERRRDQKRWQGHEKKHASREETTLRMRHWREANREKNKFNDMRCRVYRIAKDKFGLEDSDEKEAWIQAEIEKRKSMLLLRHSRKTEWKDNSAPSNSDPSSASNVDSTGNDAQMHGSNNGSNNNEPSEGDRNFIEMLKTSNGPRRRRSRQALTAAGTPLRSVAAAVGGMANASTVSSGGFFRSDSPNMVQSPVTSMMAAHSFLSSHAADRRFSAPDGSQLFGQGGSGNAMHTPLGGNFGIGLGSFNSASNGGVVDYKRQPYQQQSPYHQQDPLLRRPRKQRSATESSKPFMQSGWDSTGFFSGFSSVSNASSGTGSTTFGDGTGAATTTNTILRHDEFGPYHQHYTQQQSQQTSSSSHNHYSSSSQLQQQQQQHQALLAMPIGSEQDNRLQELYQGVYHQQQKAAEAAAAAAAAATVSGFADPSSPSQQQPQYSIHDSMESMTASLSISHPRDTSSSSAASDATTTSTAGWVDWSSPSQPQLQQQFQQQQQQPQHHYQTQQQPQHAYQPHMYSYQSYSTDPSNTSQQNTAGGTNPASNSEQAQQPQVEEVWKAGMDRLGEYPFPEMTGHANPFGPTASHHYHHHHHNNKHRKTAKEAGIRLDIPPSAPVTNSLMSTVAAAAPMEKADGLGPATA